MYRLISVISYIIRQYILPNPFIYMTSKAESMNYIFGGLLIPLSFILTKFVELADSSISKSVFFLINYSLLTGIILIIGKICSIFWLAIVLFFVLYFLLCYIERIVFSR